MLTGKLPNAALSKAWRDASAEGKPVEAGVGVSGGLLGVPTRELGVEPGPAMECSAAFGGGVDGGEMPAAPPKVLLMESQEDEL